MKNSRTNYSVITLATNKLSYAKFALNCAQSVLLFNNIKIYIISNLDFTIPDDLKPNVFILKIKSEHAALGIGAKLYIDHYLQTENTLFIDADCLCYDKLDPIFKACEGKNVSVAGTIVDAEVWCGIRQAYVIDKNFGIKQLIRFNGGLYFLKKTPKTTLIFDFARSIVPHYDNYGFQRIKNRWINEEGPLSIAMMKYNETPIPDNGCYFTDLYTDPHPYRLNVLKGFRKLNNPMNCEFRHRPWYKEGVYSPIILHFGGQKLRSFPYISQHLLLKINKYNKSIILSTWIVRAILTIPYQIRTSVVFLLRRLVTNIKK